MKRKTMFALIKQSEDFDLALIDGTVHYRTWDEDVCDFNDWRPLFN